MRKVLFLCNSYISGGAERAFVSLLQSLPLDQIETHIIAIKEEGLFKDQLPKDIIIQHAPNELATTFASIKSRYFWKRAGIKDIYRKVSTIVKGKLTSVSKRLNSQQYFWSEVKTAVPKNEIKYDVVISFMNGFCNYYAIDKVEAKRKYLWVHNDYNKIGYNSEYDQIFFEKATGIITISEICADSLKENFPNLIDKISVIENISPTTLIRNRSKEQITDIDTSTFDITFISVGRLNQQKGYDMAIEAANILNKKGVNFCWYVIGEGELLKEMKKNIVEKGLEKRFILLGTKSNPYTYIKNADIFVMTSRYEGKSIALDEAKILCKPIVSTKYPSVYDNIEDGINGILVEQDATSIAGALYKLSADKDLREKLAKHLSQNNTSNEDAVVRQIMDLINQ